MKDTLFHRQIPALTHWQFAGLQATAAKIREALSRGCDCVGIESWGHTTACSMQTSEMVNANQTVCEAEYLRIKNGKIEAYMDAPFIRGNARWIEWCGLNA